MALSAEQVFDNAWEKVVNAKVGMRQAVASGDKDRIEKQMDIQDDVWNGYRAALITLSNVGKL